MSLNDNRFLHFNHWISRKMEFDKKSQNIRFQNVNMRKFRNEIALQRVHLNVPLCQSLEAISRKSHMWKMFRFNNLNSELIKWCHQAYTFRAIFYGILCDYGRNSRGILLRPNRKSDVKWIGSSVLEVDVSMGSRIMKPFKYINGT